MFAEFDNKGGTDWAQKSVPQMWSMLAAHDGTAHKNLLVTWRQSADLLIDHLSRVKRYRDNLAEAWPPDKSQAAAKYMDRLDDLIGHLSSTYHATVENHRALGIATSALVGARLKLESIYRQHMASQQELDAYTRKLETNQQVTGKYRPITLNPPTAAQARQAELQLQAQSVMSNLSTDLAQAQLNITTPKLYSPYGKFYESEPFNPDGIGSTAPFPTSSPSAGGSPTTPSASSATQTYQTNPISNSSHIAQSAIQQTGQQGPPLSGPTPPSAELDVPPSVPTQPNKVTQLSNNPNSFIPISGTTPFSPQPTYPRSSTYPLQESTSSELRKTQNPITGGIIGGPPPTGGTRPGMNTPRTRQVNPVGGIIGGHGAATGSPIGPGKKSGSRDDETTRKSWDPDDPWATEEGISPILLPPEKKAIDPGPAIGLPPYGG
ncbi:hypothetical protein [Actinoplanes sp. L3-i22]|uniref:hypothetical protein n=1 Tax=Actinoplanes sp. L3-i22 TaxID=2836373 RepID=UPI001C78EF52|nr:hypothetical protein [Actinoplanes sp. L3-i22]BCY14968.1 hypothetical protein L3i22_100560 [Actinoplanes sp. L3-i22]